MSACSARGRFTRSMIRWRPRAKTGGRLLPANTRQSLAVPISDLHIIAFIRESPAPVWFHLSCNRFRVDRRSPANAIDRVSRCSVRLSSLKAASAAPCSTETKWLDLFTVSRKRRTALTLCFDAVPRGKRYALFPGKPHTPFLETVLADARPKSVESLVFRSYCIPPDSEHGPVE